LDDDQSGDTWLLLIVLLFSLALVVAATIAETGLILLSRGRGKYTAKMGSKGPLDQRLLEQPALLLPTVTLTKSIGAFSTAAFSIALALRFASFAWWLAAASAAALGCLLALQLLASIVAARRPEGTTWLIFRAATLKPFSFITRLGLSIAKRTEAPGLEVDELQQLVEIGANGAIEEDEKQMIRGVIGLDKTTAREIMVPRMDVVAVEVGTPLVRVMNLIIERGLSRIPLYEGTIDNVVGVIYAKDLLAYLRTGTSVVSLRDMARPAHFIPESKKIDELLREFRQKRVHIAIVVDEYGGTAGLVTIEDLLEEIVGEIEDEYDVQEVRVERLNDNEAIMDARVSINDLNEMFGLNIEAQDFDTVGGYLYSLLGKIPGVGDEVFSDGLNIAVLSTVGRRIKKVKVSLLMNGQSPSSIDSAAV